MDRDEDQAWVAEAWEDDLPGDIQNLEFSTTQTWLELLNYQLGLNNLRAPRLICSQDALNFRCSFEIPNFQDMVDVEQVGETIEWRFDIPQAIEEEVGLSGSVKSTASIVAYKIRHDFVAEAFGVGSTDFKLRDKFVSLGDEDDILSPDVYLEDRMGTIYVVELSTSRSASEFDLIRAFREKMFKYDVPLRNRVRNKPIVYVVIIVGREVVVSNVQLTQKLVDELLVRMSITVALENVAERKGIVITSSTDQEALSVRAREIEFKLSQVGPGPRPSPNRVAITEEFREKILQPPDKDIVYTNFMASIHRTKERLNNPDDQGNHLLKYIKTMLKNQDVRVGGKSVINVPLVLVKSGSESRDVSYLFIPNLSNSSEEMKLWSLAMSQVSNSPNFRPENKQKLLDEAYDIDPPTLSTKESSRKQFMKTANIVNLKDELRGCVLEKIQKDGVLARSAKDNPVIQDRKKQQKKPLSWEADISDIDKFLDDATLLEVSEEGYVSANDQVLRLIGMADDISGSQNYGTTFLKSWMKTKLFIMLELISDLMVELAAEVKRNVNRTEFILKKLRYRDVYILIKPTTSKSHMFFSLLIPSSQVISQPHNSVFRNMREENGYYIMDFSSVNVSKIENLANSVSILLSMATFWAEFYGLETCSPDEFMANDEAKKMLYLSILIALEDKAQTEEVITQTRYMYMELFKGTINIAKPNPFKILKKFPTQIRSRLCLWCVRSIIASTSIMVASPPIRKIIPNSPDLPEGEDVYPGDQWIGLLNMLTGGPISSATSAVNLMYLGYLKNKNEIAEGNTEFKMVEKILEEEFEMDDRNPDGYYGDVDPGSLPPKKGFDWNSIAYGVDIMAEELARDYGPDWKETVHKELMNKLSRIMTEEIATLKASSTCSHDSRGDKVKVDKIDRASRVKVIEAIACNLGLTGLNPMLNLPALIEMIENTSKGVVCDLFKKNQHGGLREIYVLTIQSRLIQLFIETISRCLCSHFKEETLTHPSHKIRALDEHRARMAKEASRTECVYADYSSSSDKTRWNQNLVMTALSIPLLRLTKPELHNPIVRCLNMWADKLILIPPEVQKLLLNKTMLSSKPYEELLKKWWGLVGDFTTTRGLVNHGGVYLNPTSGMMQGILHFTSSLLHVAHLKVAKRMVLAYLKKRHKDAKFYMNQVCSSDDSATIITVMIPGSEMTKSKPALRAFFEADLMLETLTDFCRYFCMRESEKSTTSLCDYIEFNSEFLMKNTIALPVIKFVIASLSLTESSSFIKRFQTMYNLISDARAAGLGSVHAYQCSISQAVQHYRTMGSHSSVVFKEYTDRILELPSPVHGFFLTDNVLTTGLMGYSFCLWMAYTADESLAQTLSPIDYTELEVMPDGGIVESLSIRHGDFHRWHKLIDRIYEGTMNPHKPSMKKIKATGMREIIQERDEEINGSINRDPSLFFRRPDNMDELKVKLLIKARMPGVPDSLSKGHPFIQSLSMSIYSIYGHAFSQTRVKKTIEGGVHKRKKVTVKHSLLSSLREYKEQKNEEQTHDELQERLKMRFPLLQRYEEAMEVIQSYRNFHISHAMRFRFKSTILRMEPDDSTLPITLSQACARAWYDIPSRCSHSIWRRCWAVYCAQFPWLMETFERTLEASPFDKPIELYSFLASQTSRSRHFKFTGPSLRSNRLIGQISQMIRKGFKAWRIISRPDETLPPPEKLDKLATNVSLALAIPRKDIRNSETKRYLSEISKEVRNVGDVRAMSKRKAALTLIALYHDKRLNDMEVQTLMREMNQGITAVYHKAQRKVVEGGREQWKGRGVVCVHADGIRMMVYLDDDVCTEIRVRDVDRLCQQASTLRSVFDYLGCKPPGVMSGGSGCMVKFNGSNFVSHRGVGTPIYRDPYLEDPFFDPPKMYLKIEHDALGIYSRIRGRDVPMVPYKTGPRDLSMYDAGGTDKEAWRAWCEMRQLALGSVVTFLEGLKKQIESPRTSIGLKAALKEWVKTTLKARLTYKGVGLVQYMYQDSIRSVDDSDDLLNDSDLEMFLLEASEPSELLSEGGLFKRYEEGLTLAAVAQQAGMEEEYEGMDDDEIGALMQGVLKFDHELNPLRAVLCNITHEDTALSRRVTGRSAQNYLYLHPFWDSLIVGISKEDSRFFPQILSGVVPLKDQGLARLLMSLLEIPEREQEKEISMLWARASTSMVPVPDPWAEAKEDEEASEEESSDDSYYTANR